MNSQGDVALIIEQDNRTGQCIITGQAKPHDGVSFGEKEVRDVYLEQAVQEPNIEDNEREKLYKYFCQTAYAQDRKEYLPQPRGMFGQNRTGAKRGTRFE